jgi:hypothetical protein
MTIKNKSAHGINICFEILMTQANDPEHRYLRAGIKPLGSYVGNQQMPVGNYSRSNVVSKTKSVPILTRQLNLYNFIVSEAIPYHGNMYLYIYIYLFIYNV